MQTSNIGCHHNIIYQWQWHWIFQTGYSRQWSQLHLILLAPFYAMLLCSSGELCNCPLWRLVKKSSGIHIYVSIFLFHDRPTHLWVFGCPSSNIEMSKCQFLALISMVSTWQSYSSSSSCADFRVFAWFSSISWWLGSMVSLNTAAFCFLLLTFGNNPSASSYSIVLFPRKHLKHYFAFQLNQPVSVTFCSLKPDCREFMAVCKFFLFCRIEILSPTASKLTCTSPGMPGLQDFNLLMDVTAIWAPSLDHSLYLVIKFFMFHDACQKQQCFCQQFESLLFHLLILA